MPTKHAQWRTHRWFTTHASAATMICSRCYRVKIVGVVGDVGESCGPDTDVVHSTHGNEAGSSLHIRRSHAGAGLLVRLDSAGNVDVLFRARLLRPLDADAGLRYVHTTGCVGRCCDRRAIPVVRGMNVDD